jgi:hypothetical protein
MLIINFGNYAVFTGKQFIYSGGLKSERMQTDNI